jgi:heat shock protein HtpX
MSEKISLARRAAIAMFLSIGFYSLAIFLGLGTIAIPFLIAHLTGHLYIKLGIACLATGGAILIAILPHKDEFVPPGPLLEPDEHPRLFEILKSVAQRAEQTIPRFVYLLPDFNAWVAERGGIGRYGRCRIMGIGLPLLCVMNISQFRAIIAHEFGHYHHGDTKLGARIYKTRQAMARTIKELQNRNSKLKKPFLWYGLKYLAITQSISRNQELNADRLAAEIAGKTAMTSALKEMTGKAVAYDLYLKEEFWPLISHDRLPPFMEGFNLFLKSKRVQNIMSNYITNKLRGGVADQYDTHPALRERIAFIDKLSAESANIDDNPSITLLTSAIDQEKKLLGTLINEKYCANMKPIGWDRKYRLVYVDPWYGIAKKNAQSFNPTRVKDLPDLIKNTSTYMKRIPKEYLGDTDAMQLILNERVYALSAALAVLLIRNGWELESAVGESTIMRKGELEIKPFDIISQLIGLEITEEQWLYICEKSGVGDKLIYPVDENI